MLNSYDSTPKRTSWNTPPRGPAPTATRTPAPVPPAVKRLTERRDELVQNPRSWPEWMAKRALLAEEVAHERGAARDFAALEIEDTDRAIRERFPNAGDPAFRAMFVRDHNRGDRPWPTLEQQLDVRALATTTSNAPNAQRFVDTLFASLTAQSPLLKLATVVPTPTGEPVVISFVDTDITANGVIADGASITVADPTMGRVALQTAFKYADRLVLSSELADDGLWDFAAYAARSLAKGPTLRSFGTACMTGDGSGEPLGIAHASAGLSATTAASATLLALDDVAACIQSSSAAAVVDESFAMLFSLDAFGDLLRATEGTSGAGGRSISPGGYAGRLWNIPCYIDSALGSTATGVTVAVVGAFKSAYVVRVCPVRVDVDRHATLATDQVGVRAVLRADGQPMDITSARTIKMA